MTSRAQLKSECPIFCWTHLSTLNQLDLIKLPPPLPHLVLSAYKSDIMKVGLLRCREEPPKLLQGTKFQERTFQIKEHKLLLLKDKKVGAASL